MGSMKEEMKRVAAEMAAQPEATPNVEPAPKVETKVEVKPEVKTETKEPPKETKTDNKSVSVPKVEAPKEPQKTSPGPASEEPLELPVGWAAEKKEAFKSLPKDVQDYVRTREKDRDSSTQKKFQEAADLRKKYERYEPLDQVFEPYRQKMNMMGLTEQQVTQRLLAAQAYLDADPKKGLAELAKSYGVDLKTLSGEQPYVDPQTQALQARLDKLERERIAQQQGQVAQTQAEVNQTLQSFQEEKDTQGNPKHPHFENVRVEMGMLLQLGRAKDMQDAYDQAVWTKPELREAQMTERFAALQASRDAELKAQTDKAKAAGLNIKGSSPSDVVEEDPKTWKGRLKATAKQLADRG